MTTDPESPDSQTAYRTARRAFITACEKAHVETVARLHPSKGADGKPLFMDCAAVGPRRSTKAALVVGYDASGSEVLIALLSQTPPPDTKLVLVHALDPAAFAGVKTDPAWPTTMLGAVAVEDLSHAHHLAVLPLGRDDDAFKPLLQAHLPRTGITVLPQAATASKAWREITAFFAAH
jgi:hypothetical protein